MAANGFQMLFQSIRLGSWVVAPADSESDKAAGRLSLEHAQMVLIAIFLLSTIPWLKVHSYILMHKYMGEKN
jgi:hypothetical protein